MPAPYVFTVGASWRPIPRLLLAFDAQLNGWGTYKKLDITFAGLPEMFNQYLTKDYHNAMTYHLGGEFALTERFDVRAGLMVDCSPCNTDYYNPETPGMTKIEPSVGLSFRPLKGLSIDVAFMYVHGCGSSGTGEFDDFIAPIYNQQIGTVNPTLQALGKPALEPLPTTGTFKADYKLNAIIPAIGVSYQF